MEILKEDIDLVRLALSVYHTRTVYPGCVEAFDRILSAQQVKAETVDLPKREMRNPVEQGGKSNDWYQNGYDVGYNAAIDEILQNYNITRKTK